MRCSGAAMHAIEGRFYAIDREDIVRKVSSYRSECLRCLRIQVADPCSHAFLAQSSPSTQSDPEKILSCEPVESLSQREITQNPADVLAAPFET